MNIPRVKWSWRREEVGRYLIILAAGVVGYFLLAKLGLGLAKATGGPVAVVWPPSGAALVLLLVLGCRFWPVIFLGATLVGLTLHDTFWVILGTGLGNTIEAVLAAYLLTSVLSFRGNFAVPRDVWALAFAASVATFVAAMIGAGLLLADRLVPASNFWSVVGSWWLGDLMGMLLLVPFLLTLVNPKTFRILQDREIEFGFILALTLASSVYVMTSTHGLPYLLFPVVTLAAIRLTQVGVVSSVILVTGVAIWATSNNLGPFYHLGPGPGDYVALQVYVLILMATSLVVAMATRQHMEVENTLKHIDNQLTEANLRVTNILADVLEDGPKRGRDRTGKM